MEKDVLQSLALARLKRAEAKKLEAEAAYLEAAVQAALAGCQHEEEDLEEELTMAGDEVRTFRCACGEVVERPLEEEG